ncbi:MAG: hypothetical protein WC735_04785 [Candidatus Paceibacterota bacterium]|jgi:hypothetical protein
MINPKFKDTRTEEEKRIEEEMTKEFVDGLNKAVDERETGICMKKETKLNPGMFKTESERKESDKAAQEFVDALNKASRENDNNCMEKETRLGIPVGALRTEEQRKESDAAAQEFVDALNKASRENGAPE